MKLLAKIAFRHLLSKYNFGFISFSTFYSIFGLFLGVSSLIIITCISQGFNETINKNLSSIDGHIRINKYFNQSISKSNLEKIDSLFLLKNININSYYPFIEKHAVIRNKSYSQGVIVYGVDEKALNEIFNLNNFSKKNSHFNQEKNIIIGQKLSGFIKADIQEDIIMFNPEKMIQDKSLNASKFKIDNIFKTNFPEYDKILTFISIEEAQKIFNMQNMFSGILINTRNIDEIDNIKSELESFLNEDGYFISSWKDRHYNLLRWLNVYDIPIKIIMIFIIIVGVLNIAASLWMIIIEKTQEYAILMTLGLSRKNILTTILLQGFFIGILGVISAIIFSFIFLKVQLVYKFISIPADIYFMAHLPVKISFSPFIFYPLIAFTLTLLFSYIPAIYGSKNNIVKSLDYE